MVSWFCKTGRCAIACVLMCLCLTSCIPNPAAQTSTQAILEFVPRQAVLTTTIDVSSNSITTWQQSALGPKLSQTLTSLLYPLNIDIAEDILPWLGDTIAVAVTDKDLDQDSHNGRQVGYLMVAEVADSERLREFLRLFWQHQSVAGERLHLTQVNGVPMITGNIAQTSHQLATALVGEKTLLVGNDSRVLRQSLRVAQSPPLQMAAPHCCAPLWLRLQIPSVIDWLGVAVPEKTKFMENHWEIMTATADLQPQAIAINTRLRGVRRDFDQSSKLERASLNPLLLQYLPETMAWVILGHDGASSLTNLQTELAHYRKLPTWLKQVQQLPSLGYNLAEHVSQLLSHDYSLGQFEDGSWLMAVANVQPRLLQQLDEIATEAGLTISPLELNGHTVTAWSQLTTQINQDALNRETTVETDLMALRTKIGDYHVFSTSLSGLTKALTAPSQSLSSTTQRLQRTMPGINSPNQNYIYGTWNKIERLLASKRWFSLIKPIVEPWGQSIDAIAFTSHGHGDHQLTGTISVLLKK